MPNTKSSKKDVLKIERNRQRNQAVRSKVKTVRAKAIAAVKSDVATSAEAVQLALKELDSAATKGIIHKNTAARRKSRLVKQLNAAGAKA